MHLRLTVLLLLLPLLPLHAEDAGTMLDEPRVLSRIVAALEKSEIDELTSHKSVQDGKEYSYHLKTVDYLGSLERFGKRYVLATAFFLRSSAKGSEYPPARGHCFILILDTKDKVASYARIERGNYYLSGDELKRDGESITDFASKEPLTRYRGWLVDGAKLPYPFDDKISEKDWESGAFKEKGK
ncbi:hypothetical protein [Roseimicrobium sp. ORNL1]|uniref:hypothetical protein n=1 Tax=Roseimicrobium sp. ORNL1 TaxID=2711231 RepID=UPI0013E131AC|nr:hypothetical protein [Roseimicrobium sp. ORNL1]QIF00151.1 hypothetical protein G5S37_00970 [Roseimicrobium sp. ORNL1]